MNNHFNCIYCYTNKVNGKKYVGQAKNFNKRHNKHISSSYNINDKNKNVPFHCAIRKYGIDKFEVEILKENLQTQDELNYWERFYIIEFDTLAKNKKGYNVSDGGSNGNSFAGKTDEEMFEIKKKMSKNHANILGENNPNYNNKWDDEKRKKSSEKMKNRYNGELNPFYGQHHTEETRKHLSEQKKGKKHHRARKIAQYDLQGNLIRVWDYMRQIEEEIGILHGGISQCCNDKKDSYKGFKWKFFDMATLSEANTETVGTCND